MSDCCSNKSCELEALRVQQAAMLKVVLAINAAMFVIEMLAGLASGSASLVSDSLDMLGDAMVYAFSIYAVAQSARIKAQSALLKGVVMAAFAVLALGQVIYKLAVPQVPSFEVIGGVGLLALAANGICFAMLWRHRSDDINMSSVWLCSRNDLIANVGVIAAAGAVWFSGTRWPDIIVGVAIAVLFAKSAITVLTGAARELRQISAED